MRMVRSLTAVVAVALAVGACTGEVMTSRLHRANSDTFFTYGAAKGDMLAVIAGNPFPVSRAALDQAVVEAMRNHHNGPMTRFSTSSGPAAVRDYRVVVAFDTSPAMDTSVLCGRPEAIPTGHPTAGRLRAEMAFCVGSDLYTSVDIGIPAVATPDDPAFKHMIASAMWQLIPARDPLSADEGVCPGIGC